MCLNILILVSKVLKKNNKILQVFSDEPNVNLSFLKILDEHRRDAELNPLIDIGTCVLHTVYNSFKYGKKDGNWNIKKLLNLMFKLFDESRSRCAGHESITSASKCDFTLRFYSHRWIGNDVVSRKALSIWPKMLEVLISGKDCLNPNNLVEGDPGKRKVMNFYVLR